MPDWLTFLATVAIPIVSAIGGFLGARWGRYSAFRERIFDKQIDAYLHIIELMEGFVGVMELFDPESLEGCHTKEQYSNALHKYHQNISTSISKFNENASKLAIFTAPEVNGAFLRFIHSTTNIIFQIENYPWQFVTGYNYHHQLVRDEYTRTIRAIRLCIGTDNLMLRWNNPLKSWVQSKQTKQIDATMKERLDQLATQDFESQLSKLNPQSSALSPSASRNLVRTTAAAALQQGAGADTCERGKNSS